MKHADKMSEQWVYDKSCALLMRMVASNLLFNFELPKAIPSCIVCIFRCGPIPQPVLDEFQDNKWTSKVFLIGMHHISCVNLNVVLCVLLVFFTNVIENSFGFPRFINSLRHYYLHFLLIVIQVLFKHMAVSFNKNITFVSIW